MRVEFKSDSTVAKLGFFARFDAGNLQNISEYYWPIHKKNISVLIVTQLNENVPTLPFPNTGHIRRTVGY